MESTWNQNQPFQTSMQNECIVRLTSSVPTNIIFQQFEMCNHQMGDLLPNQHVVCNCKYHPNPEVTMLGVNAVPVVPKILDQVPSQPLTRSDAALYGSNLVSGQSYLDTSNMQFLNQPTTNFSSFVPSHAPQNPNLISQSLQNHSINLQYSGRPEGTPQDLLANGQVGVKEEPLEVDDFCLETFESNSAPRNHRHDLPPFSPDSYLSLPPSNVNCETRQNSPARSFSQVHGFRKRSKSPRDHSPRRRRSRSPWKYSPSRTRSLRRHSPTGCRSPKRGSPRRSRSPRKYSPIRCRSQRRYSPRRKYSPTRNKNPRNYSPTRGRNSRKLSPARSSPRPKSRTRSRSPRLYSPTKSKSQRAYSPTKSKSPRKSPRRSSSPTPRTSNSTKNSNVDKNKLLDPAKDFEKEKSKWTRTAPADLYYKLELSNSQVVHGTGELSDLCEKFEEQLLKKPEAIRAELPKYEPFPKRKMITAKKHSHCHSCSSSNNDSSSDSDLSDHEDLMKEELEYKRNHPLRLHEELWFNHPGEMNDGPLCRCSAKARRSGIRHNIYAGENHITSCDPNSNNADKLYHYRVTMSPPTNFLVKLPTIIEYDAHEYIFEGFSMFSHKKLGDLPHCKVIRFNIEYTIVYYEEKFPQNFTVRELNYFHKYMFHELLELVDLDFRVHGDTEGCPQYHFMPRFVRELPGNGKEILSMNEVLKYLLQSHESLVEKSSLNDLLSISQNEWQDFTDKIKGMIVTYPGKKPCSLRIDQLDREPEQDSKEEDSTTNLESEFPQIVHFGMRPPELSYAGNPEYQKAWREYVKFRHLLANMPKPSFEDKRKLKTKEIRLQNLRTKNELKRNVTVTISSEHFYKTGVMCDMVQHALLLPVLVSHLRFHRSLDVLEDKINYVFNNRYLLQLALTHPSYRENFGTNPDHARNSLTNCGIRQPVYGDRRIHYMNTRKRGINTLINIMSKFGKTKETESNITHNERLEFLGDAVVEFVTSVHLFHIFSDLEEGGLATYRSAIVQNQHLAVLAKKLGLEAYMLYAHGSDLCHDLELRHAMANCFEALMGALFLDGGIEIADRVFGEALFQGEPDLLEVWVDYPPHPLQDQEPLGDRKWIDRFPFLTKLNTFEESIGVEFTHIRLLARAFTDRSIGYTNLTLGSNQRLEFLGDTVLQLIASEYLYKFFPEHHEGHLSLLRSSLVNNRTQAVVCDDLGMTAYALYSNPKAELKTKDRADLLEAFLGALYVDKNLKYCETFCSVCFFPRLQTFILHQDWNDPKSKLQQCCLTLRTMKGGEPEIPVYKVIESKGPTNTRIYTVAVYFKGKRLAEAAGHSIQQAEMNAAKKALKLSQGLFPQLDHQKRVISKSMNHQTPGNNKKQSKKSSENKPGPSSNDLDHSRRSRTPPLAYQSRNSPETTEMLKRKGKKKNEKKENKKSYITSKERESVSPPKKKDTKCIVHDDNTEQRSSCSANKQKEGCSKLGCNKNKFQNISESISNRKQPKSNPIDKTSLQGGPSSDFHGDQHLSKSSSHKRPCNSPTSRRSRSVSSERSRTSDFQSSSKSNQPKSYPTDQTSLQSRPASELCGDQYLSKSSSCKRPRYSPASGRPRSVSSERSRSKTRDFRSSSKSNLMDQTSLQGKPVSKLRRDQHLSKSPSCKRPRNSPASRRSRSLSSERSRTSDSQISNRTQCFSSQSRNISSSKRTSNESKLRSPPRHRTRRSQSRSPKRYYSPERREPQHKNSRSPSRYHSSTRPRGSPNRQASSGRNTRSPAREEARKNFMDFMLGKRGIESNKDESNHILSEQSVGSYQFQTTSGQILPNVPASFQQLPMNTGSIAVQPLNRSLPPNIFIPPPSTNHIPHRLDNHLPSSVNSLPSLAKTFAPPSLKNIVPFHKGLPPNIRSCPPNISAPPANCHIPPLSSHKLPFNNHIPLPNSHILPPPSRSQMPPPNCHVPPPNNHITTANNCIPPPNSHILPPNARIPHTNSHILPPNGHIPPPNSYIPPPNTKVPPPNSHIPSNIHIQPSVHKEQFARMASSLPYSQNNFYQP